MSSKIDIDFINRRLNVKGSEDYVPFSTPELADPRVEDEEGAKFPFEIVATAVTVILTGAIFYIGADALMPPKSAIISAVDAPKVREPTLLERPAIIFENMRKEVVKVLDDR